MTTYPTEQWTDEQCENGLIEAMINMGDDAIRELIDLVFRFRDHAKVMEYLEQAYVSQRKKPIPDDIRNGLALAVEGCIREYPSYLKARQSDN